MVQASMDAIVGGRRSVSCEFPYLEDASSFAESSGEARCSGWSPWSTQLICSTFRRPESSRAHIAHNGGQLQTRDRSGTFERARKRATRFTPVTRLRSTDDYAEQRDARRAFGLLKWQVYCELPYAMQIPTTSRRGPRKSHLTTQHRVLFATSSFRRSVATRSEVRKWPSLRSDVGQN
ncbi:hypothetical protein MRX96_036772 [Rhipicephalus microplus]